jgi:hypothetical protein
MNKNDADKVTDIINVICIESQKLVNEKLENES